MNTEQLRWALVGAKNEGGSYVLPDSVREFCPCLNVRAYERGLACPSCESGENHEKCEHCHGLGYTPATDLETWLEVLAPLAAHGLCLHHSQTGWWSVSEFGAAGTDLNRATSESLWDTVLTAMLLLLQSQGVKLGVKDG